MAITKHEKEKEILQYIERTPHKNLYSLSEESIVLKFKDEQYDDDQIIEILENLIECKAVGQRDLELSIYCPLKKMDRFDKTFKDLIVEKTDFLTTILIAYASVLLTGYFVNLELATGFLAGSIVFVFALGITELTNDYLEDNVPKLSNYDFTFIKILIISLFLISILTLGLIQLFNLVFEFNYLYGMGILSIMLSGALWNYIYKPVKEKEEKIFDSGL